MTPKPAKGPAKPAPETRLVKKNKKALFNYEILERLEAGIVLTGPEVKSLRQGLVSLDEAYARIVDADLWLIGAHIDEYAQRGYAPHDPKRKRKLLIHKRERLKLAAQVKEKGLTLVPISLYFKHGLAKLEIGVARGRKLFDKRESLKKRDASREIQRVTGRGKG